MGKNIVKQAQYLTDDHPNAACLYHLVHHLQIPQLILLHQSPPLPLPALQLRSRTPPRSNQNLPSQNPKQLPLLFIAPITPKSVFFAKIVLLTENTWEAFSCVRLHQKDLEGAFRLFKVLTLSCAEIFELFVFYLSVYSGT